MQRCASQLRSTTVVVGITVGMMFAAAAQAATTEGARVRFAWSAASGPVSQYGVWVTRNGEEAETPSQFVETPSVEVAGTAGAGDAFAGGFTYGLLQGWDLYKACRMGNACGAILVTRHGCANFMPTVDEVEGFVAEFGGL